MNDNETYEFESRRYIEPTLSSGEQMNFIDNFRDIQNQNNQQIATDTYNLGTRVPSNLGGLGGGEAYFNQRYQTDQVDDMVANLKAAAQAQALNDVMSNYQAQLKQRYSQAQRKYNKRQRAKQNALLNSSNSGNTNGVVEKNATDIPVDPNKTYASAWSDSKFPYNVTQYQYSPTGEIITEYYNPETGNTYKMSGDKLISNGKSNSVFGKIYYDVLEKTGRFPTDF